MDVPGCQLCHRPSNPGPSGSHDVPMMSADAQEAAGGVTDNSVPPWLPDGSSQGMAGIAKDMKWGHLVI